MTSKVGALKVRTDDPGGYFFWVLQRSRRPGNSNAGDKELTRTAPGLSSPGSFPSYFHRQAGVEAPPDVGVIDGPCAAASTLVSPGFSGGRSPWTMNPRSRNLLRWLTRGGGGGGGPSNGGEPAGFVRFTVAAEPHMTESCGLPSRHRAVPLVVRPSIQADFIADNVPSAGIPHCWQGW